MGVRAVILKLEMACQESNRDHFRYSHPNP
jgi:hypothetical protein